MLVLNAHLEGILGVALARKDARCAVPLNGKFDDRAAVLWHALHTKLDDAAREKYMVNYRGTLR
jgi:hypothetical protein